MFWTPTQSKTNLAMHNRRLPPPWSVEELDACFVVRDDNGQKLTYVDSSNYRLLLDFDCASGGRIAVNFV
jgi:hypothetical protein